MALQLNIKLEASSGVEYVFKVSKSMSRPLTLSVATGPGHSLPASLVVPVDSPAAGRDGRLAGGARQPPNYHGQWSRWRKVDCQSVQVAASGVSITLGMAVILYIIRTAR